MSVPIQFRRGSAAQWTSANPILREGELGVELDTGLYKLGDGVTAWVSLPYPTLSPAQAVATMPHQASHPSVPAAGSMRFYARSLGGRMLPRILGPAGLSTPLQPSFFQNQIVMLSTGGGTAISTLGSTVTSAGTLSHPAATENYGYTTNFVTAGTLAATAGTGTASTIYMRGALEGGANGFFFASRLAFPDASYNQTGAATGTRLFVGMTSGTMAASVGADNNAGHHVGFQRCHTDAGRQDTHWQIIARDGVTQSQASTLLDFLPEKVYDFYLFCPPRGATVYWRVDNVTDGVSKEGEVTANLPSATTLLRGGFQLQSVDAVARNIRMQRVYLESDR